jgi:predicted phosphodiesterase
MKVGLLSDAHGNPWGLHACVEALRRLRIDSLYFLGDAIGYFAREGEVLDRLRREGVHCQIGNHEGMLLGQLPLDPDRDRLYGIGKVRTRLSEEARRRIAGWPQQREVQVGGRTVLMIHGSPRDPLTGYVYPDGDLAEFDGLPFDAIFVGNTHRAFVSRRGTSLIANVGSCGMPRDHGRLASFAVYDSEANACELFRVPFDVDALAASFGSEDVPYEFREIWRRVPGGGLTGTVLPACEVAPDPPLPEQR